MAHTVEGGHLLGAVELLDGEVAAQDVVVLGRAHRDPGDGGVEVVGLAAGLGRVLGVLGAEELALGQITGFLGHELREHHVSAVVGTVKSLLVGHGVHHFVSHTPVGEVLRDDGFARAVDLEIPRVAGHVGVEALLHWHTL